jgi:hypothetical protein
MKRETTNKEVNKVINLLEKIDKVYYFGFFQKLGIAKSEEEEYKYRDILSNAHLLAK